MRIAFLAALAAAILSFLVAPSAYGECDYGFSGQVMVENYGVQRPLVNAKIRVRREGGTGAFRKFVVTDTEGRFDGTWSFDRDQNGVLPGGGDINFAIQVQFRDEGRLKVVKGGWTDAPWDTIKTVSGRGCTRFIWTDPIVIRVDGLRPGDLHKRAWIYMVYHKVLTEMEKSGVGLKNQIEVIYPDRHIYSRESSWFIHKAHIEDNDWKDTRTLIHEMMHQWDINWMHGETTLTCLTDAHHKPPEARGAKRCSGFMEGFAEATALEIYKKVLAPDPFYWANGKKADWAGGPFSHEFMRTEGGKPDSSGVVQNTSEAERNDDGWRNFLQFIMTKDVWKPFDSGKNPGLYPLSDCNPRRVPVFELLAALKAESPNHGGDSASFPWFTDIMEHQVSGFTRDDAVFYQLLGNPAADPVDIQVNRCSAQREAMDRMLDPLKKPDMKAITKKPLNKPVTVPSGVIKPKGIGD